MFRYLQKNDSPQRNTLLRRNDYEKINQVSCGATGKARGSAHYCLGLTQPFLICDAGRELAMRLSRFLTRESEDLGPTFDKKQRCCGPFLVPGGEGGAVCRLRAGWGPLHSFVLGSLCWGLGSSDFPLPPAGDRRREPGKDNSR